MEKEFDQADHRVIEGVPSALSVKEFNLWYKNGDFQALKHIGLEIPEKHSRQHPLRAFAHAQAHQVRG